MQTAPHYLVIVRRGETRLFEELMESRSYWPELTTVMWDRRVGDRRSADRPVPDDRRHGERRSPPDPMWGTHGFVVVKAPRPDETASSLRDATTVPAT